MRVLKEGNAGDRNCALRINKISETCYLEAIDVTFSTRDIQEKIRGDYDLEEKGRKQRLENKRSLRHLMPIKVGQTCVELFQGLRGLAASLPHYGAIKDFREIAGRFLRTALMKSSGLGSFRGSISKICLGATSIGDFGVSHVQTNGN